MSKQKSKLKDEAITFNPPVSGMCFLPIEEVDDVLEIGGTFGNIELRCWDRDKEIRVALDSVDSDVVYTTYINKNDVKELIQWLVSQLGALEGKKHFR